jgi:hypothetical protein
MTSAASSEAISSKAEQLGQVVAQVIGEFLHRVGDLGDVQGGDDLGPQVALQPVEDDGHVRRLQQRQEIAQGLLVSGLDQLLQVIDFRQVFGTVLHASPRIGKRNYLSGGGQSIGM